MLEFNFYDFIICVILMIIFEVFNRSRSPAQITYVVLLRSPEQASNQSPLLLHITKNVNLLNNKTPKGNSDKVGLKNPAYRVPKSQETVKEMCRPNATPKLFLNSFETACPTYINEKAEEKVSISKAKNASANSAKQRPVTRHSKTLKDISTSQDCSNSAEMKQILSNGRNSKSKSERIRLPSPRGRKFKSKSEEIRVRSPSSRKAAIKRYFSKLESKSKADNKRNKRQKSVLNQRETSEDRNESSQKSASLSPCRLPTKLFDNITSSSEPKDKKLDLHGYIVKDAIQKFYKFYRKMINKYRSENCEEEDRYIYVVTGRGNGCPDGIPRIKPEIQNILLKMNIRHNWLNDGGLVMIDFCGQHEEMDPMELRKLTRMNRPRRKDKKKKGRNRNKGVIHDI